MEMEGFIEMKEKAIKVFSLHVQIKTYDRTKKKKTIKYMSDAIVNKMMPIS